MSGEKDWIDRAITRDGGWDPPANFVDRLAVQAFATLPRRRQQGTLPSSAERMRLLIAGAWNEMALRIQGSLWVLRQYRALLLH